MLDAKGIAATATTELFEAVSTRADATPTGAAPALADPPPAVGIGTRPSARPKPDEWR